MSRAGTERDMPLGNRDRIEIQAVLRRRGRSPARLGYQRLSATVQANRPCGLDVLAERTPLMRDELPPAAKPHLSCCWSQLMGTSFSITLTGKPRGRRPLRMAAVMSGERQVRLRTLPT